MENTILITGSNGFIGRHVCDFFRQQGYYVIGLGRRKQSVPKVDQYLKIDLDTDEISRYISPKKISAVIHLAADMRKEPNCVDVVRANCTGTQQLLEFCEKNSIDTFLQLSSLPVVGHPKQHPIGENHPLCPPTVYHCTKVMEELLADYAMRKKNIRTASFRISAPVGIGMNENTIFPTFVKKSLKNEDIIIWGKGSRQQTYIHVDDISLGLYCALISNRCKGIYNLSSYNIIANIDLAKKCIERLDSKSKIVFNNLPDSSDNDIWDVSLSKIFQDTDYRPQISLDYCIDQLATYFKNEKTIDS